MVGEGGLKVILDPALNNLGRGGGDKKLFETPLPKNNNLSAFLDSTSISRFLNIDDWCTTETIVWGGGGVKPKIDTWIFKQFTVLIGKRVSQ